MNALRSLNIKFAFWISFQAGVSDVKIRFYNAFIIRLINNKTTKNKYLPFYCLHCKQYSFLAGDLFTLTFVTNVRYAVTAVLRKNQDWRKLFAFVQGLTTKVEIMCKINIRTSQKTILPHVFFIVFKFNWSYALAILKIHQTFFVFFWKIAYYFLKSLAFFNPKLY